MLQVLGHMYFWLKKKTSNNEEKLPMTFKFFFFAISPHDADQSLGQVLEFLLVSSEKIQGTPSAFAFPTERGINFNTV